MLLENSKDGDARGLKEPDGKSILSLGKIFNLETRKGMYRGETGGAMHSVIIDRAKCTGCGECIDACPADVIDMESGKAVVSRIDSCFGCGDCLICKETAIVVSEL